ncbi:MAG TPA: tol-pal system protein YbgF [Geobacteraceae bacterium]
MRQSGCLGLGLFFLAIAGCGTNDVMLKKQMEMESRLEQLVQANATDSVRLGQLANDVKEMQARVNRLSSGMEELKQKDNDVASSLETLSQRLEGFSASRATAKIEVVNRENVPVDKDADQQQAYMKAFGLFSANNYDSAITEFEAYLKKYPKGEYAGNAQYWIGECFYTQHSYREALEAFNRVVTDYPKGSKVPDAMLKIGFTLISINEPEKGKDALQALIEKYPKSQAAAKARERLSRY